MIFSWYLWLIGEGIFAGFISPHIETDVEEQNRWIKFFEDKRAREAKK